MNKKETKNNIKLPILSKVSNKDFLKELSKREILVDDLKKINWKSSDVSSRGFNEKIKYLIERIKYLIESNAKERDVELFFRENRIIIGLILKTTKNAEMIFQEPISKDEGSAIDLIVFDDQNTYFIDFKRSKMLPFIDTPYRKRKDSLSVYAPGKDITGPIVQISEYSDKFIEKYKSKRKVFAPQKYIIGFTENGLTEDQLSSWQHFKNNQNVIFITLNDIQRMLEWFTKE